MFIIVNNFVYRFIHTYPTYVFVIFKVGLNNSSLGFLKFYSFSVHSLDLNTSLATLLLASCCKNTIHSQHSFM